MSSEPEVGARRRVLAAVGFSAHPGAADAAAEALGQVLDRFGDQLGGRRPDLAVVVTTGSHAASTVSIASGVRSLLGPATLVACTSSGISVGEVELDGRPGVGVWAVVGIGTVEARLVDRVADAEAAWSAQGDGDDGPASAQSVAASGARGARGALTVVLAHPSADLSLPDGGGRVLGGRLGQCGHPGADVVVAGDRCQRHGAVVMRFSDGSTVRALRSTVGRLGLDLARATGDREAEAAFVLTDARVVGPRRRGHPSSVDEGVDVGVDVGVATAVQAAVGGAVVGLRCGALLAPTSSLRVDVALVG